MHSQGYNPKLELVRITTAGNVDDGKSTLTGRLLYDLNKVHGDQLASIARKETLLPNGEIDFSLLTDGLLAERARKITIDVAYRYFSTSRRRFIVADVPGHVQYFQNMVSGASGADILVIVADVRRLLQPQTMKHLLVARLFTIPHVVVAVNKMDLVKFRKGAYVTFMNSISKYAESIGLEGIVCIPTAAVWGEGIVHRSKSMGWYRGPTLMQCIETIRIDRHPARKPLRYPIQLAIPQRGSRHQRYAGRLLSGSLRVGQTVRVLPGGASSKVRSIYLGFRGVRKASSPSSISVALTDNFVLRRGDAIVDPQHPATVTSSVTTEVLWLGSKALHVGDRYLVKHATKSVRCTIQHIRTSQYLLDPALKSYRALRTNGLAKLELATDSPLVVDEYRNNRFTGIFILINEETTETAAVGMIVRAGLSP